uniref:Band 3 cytoplasmic domain-containing protein n=1 Tax=Cuerna arida TaxID=1464854 RepID=A0A1B6EKH5_9HEMI
MSSFRRSSMLARIGIKGDRDGGTPEPDLDEEMEKVFATSESERFSLASISNAPESLPSTDQRRYDEQDYSSHRKKNYPHIHMPLKIMHPRSMRKRTSSHRESHEGTEGAEVPREPQEDQEPEPPAVVEEEPTTRTASPEETLPLSPPSLGQGDEGETPSSETEPLRVADLSETTSFSPDRRVQFDIDGLSDAQDDDSSRKKDKDLLEEGEKKSRKKHRHHSRKYSMPEDPNWRRKSGAFLIADSRKMSIQPEEASTLQEVDQDDLASHRFDVPKGKRRFSVRSKVSSVSIGDSRKSSMVPQTLPFYSYKKSFDHSPHKVFVQLNEFIGFGDDREWRETARWIKYEENIEEGAERWGKPHVATLSFHSLLNLRRCLETGVVLLDLEEKDLPGISYRVVEQMVIDELISAEDKAGVMRALLLRHRHVESHSDRFRFSMRRNTASYTSLQNLQEEIKSKPKMSMTGSYLEPKGFHHFPSLLETDTAKANHTAK